MRSFLNRFCNRLLSYVFTCETVLRVWLNKHIPTIGTEKNSASFKRHFPAPFFAVIIGINKYSHVRKLNGAVADALAFRTFLTRDVGVPSNHIVTLLDERARRSEVIAALEGLNRNPDIRYGDAILLYFAGHGAEVRVDDDTEDAATVPALVPQDFDARGIHPIPEYLLEALIAGIHREKGDNIIVLLDCGFTASPATQSSTLDSYNVRGISLDNTYAIPFEPSSQVTFSNTRGINLVSTSDASNTHVLLGACARSELAKERDGRGQFTLALLQILASNDFNNLTYSGAARQINVPGQTVHCEGVNFDRVIFGGSLTTPVDSYRVHYQRGAYILEAGLISDIAIGTSFALYPHPAAIGRSTALANAVVEDVDLFKSVLQIRRPWFMPFSRSHPALCAVQTKAGPGREPKLYLCPNSELGIVRNALATLKSESTEIGFLLTDDRSTAHFEISTVFEPGVTMLVATVLDDYITAHRFTSPQKKVPLNAENAAHLLQSAAHFFYHLHSSFFNPVVRDKVHVEFRELRGRTKKTLVAGDDLLRDGKLSLEVQKEKKVLHGIRLVNDSNRGLYVHVFYFDCSQLSIAHYYGKPRPNQISLGPLLPAHSSQTLGYGAEPASALSFFVPPGQDHDLGFFKFVFSTRRINLDHVPCEGPFEPPATGSQHRSTSSEGMQTTASGINHRSEAVGSLLVPIFLRNV